MAISWLLNEPGFPASELNEVLTTNRVTVPAHWPVEIGNALLMGVRRKESIPDVLRRFRLSLHVWMWQSSRQLRWSGFPL
jgi:hypothetical protein